MRCKDKVVKKLCRETCQMSYFGIDDLFNGTPLKVLLYPWFAFSCDPLKKYKCRSVFLNGCMAFRKWRMKFRISTSIASFYGI